MEPSNKYIISLKHVATYKILTNDEYMNYFILKSLVMKSCIWE